MTYGLFEKNSKGEQEPWQILKQIKGKYLKYVVLTPKENYLSLVPSRNGKNRLNYMKQFNL